MMVDLLTALAAPSGERSAEPRAAGEGLAGSEAFAAALAAVLQAGSGRAAPTCALNLLSGETPTLTDSELTLETGEAALDSAGAAAIAALLLPPSSPPPVLHAVAANQAGEAVEGVTGATAEPIGSGQQAAGRAISYQLSAVGYQQDPFGTSSAMAVGGQEETFGAPAAVTVGRQQPAVEAQDSALSTPTVPVASSDAANRAAVDEQAVLGTAATTQVGVSKSTGRTSYARPIAEQAPGASATDGQARARSERVASAPVAPAEASAASALGASAPTSGPLHAITLPAGDVIGIEISSPLPAAAAAAEAIDRPAPLATAGIEAAVADGANALPTQQAEVLRSDAPPAEGAPLPAVVGRLPVQAGEAQPTGPGTELDQGSTDLGEGSEPIAVAPTAAPGRDTDRQGDGSDTQSGQPAWQSQMTPTRAAVAEPTRAGRPIAERAEVAPVAPSGRPEAVGGELGPPAGLTVSGPSAAGPLGDERGPSPSPVEQLGPAFEQAIERPGRTVRLALQPEGLGTVALRVSVDATGLKVHIGVEQAATRDLLQASLPQLNQNLEARGLTVESLLLELGSGQLGRGAAEQQYAREFNPPGSNGRRRGGRIAEAPERVEAPERPAGRVDYRV